MNTTMADGASERLDAQIADALFGQPGMGKLDVANRLRQLRGDGSPLLIALHQAEKRRFDSSAEDRFEQFVQAEIARSPNALRELGEYLADVLDEDRFPAANRLLLQLATEYATPLTQTVDPADPWRGLYSPDMMPKLDGVNLYHVAHPDLPSWPKDEDEELGIGPLVTAQGFALAVVFGEYPDDDGEESDFCAWLASWTPDAPAGGDWRLACLQDTEDGPAAFYVRPLAPINASGEPITTPNRLTDQARVIDLGPGIEAIASERQRQLQAEGFTREGDRQYRRGELAKAATAYVQLAAMDLEAGTRNHIAWHGPTAVWPWAAEWWKPVDARRDLVRAGALIAAQIDLIDSQAIGNG